MPELFKGTPDSRRGSDSIRSPEISKKFIEQLFTSRNFETTFKKTFDLVGKHGRELGFTMFNKVGTDSVIMTEPIGGAAENGTDLGKAEDEIAFSGKYSLEDLLTVSTLHFHNTSANQDEVLVPSKADISGNAKHRDRNIFLTGFDVPPVDIIALRTSNTNSRLLIFQESLVRILTKEMITDLGLALEEASASGENQREIMRLLQNYGYKVIFIPNFFGKFSKQDLDILQRFAFIPKRKKEDEGIDENF